MAFWILTMWKNGPGRQLCKGRGRGGGRPLRDAHPPHSYPAQLPCLGPAPCSPALGTRTLDF